jgi:hypothetical protein
MDVAIRVNNKLVFKASNIMLLVLHAIVVLSGVWRYCLENTGSAQ